jgi:tRNA pseudouridine38-40 synthase
MRCIRLDVAYEGTRFHGWQFQPGLRSVQGTLEDTFARITGESVRFVAAGRTDAGVHARGQVAHLFTGSRLDARTLLQAMNALLPPDVVVKAVRDAPPTFHARKSALEKRYEYWIRNDRLPCVFSRRFVWHFKAPLDPEAMRAAARMIPGTRDFSSFQASGGPVGIDPVRTVHRVDVGTPSPGILQIVVEGVSFLRHMVRILVGTLVDVGRGRLPAPEVEAVLDARDRRAAGRTAPARGLFLMRVRYPEAMG